MPSCELVEVFKSTHERRCEGKGTRAMKIQSVSQKEVDQVYLYILNNIDDVIPYMLQHIDEIKFTYSRINEKWTLNKHKKMFLPWFKKNVYVIPNVSENLLKLARWLNNDMVTYGDYYINNYCFH